jgi:starch phosphorylase
MYHGEDPSWDAADAEQLYTLLEQQVIPEFYDRGADGVPTRWVSKVRESMARLTPQFSANRTVREYTDKYYLPGAEAYRKRSERNSALGESLLKWQKDLRRHWSALYFGDVNLETSAGQHRFTVQLYLDEVDPDYVTVELYAESPGGGPPMRQTMTRSERLIGAAAGWTYVAEVPASRAAADFTARVIPSHADAAVPLEAAQIKWQK